MNQSRIAAVLFFAAGSLLIVAAVISGVNIFIALAAAFIALGVLYLMDREN